MPIRRGITSNAASDITSRNVQSALDRYTIPKTPGGDAKAGYDLAHRDPRAPVEPSDRRDASADAPLAALRAAKGALALIVGEAPDIEPVYPSGGDVEACEAWAMNSAYWETAVTARPALAAVTAALLAAENR